MPAIPRAPATLEGLLGTWGLQEGVDGVQVTGTASPHLAAFTGLGEYDHDPAWVLDVTCRSRPEAERATTASRAGSDEQHRRDSPGDLEITVDGQVHRLAVHESSVPGVVTLNVTDATSGPETPWSGRMVAVRAGERAVRFDR